MGSNTVNSINCCDVRSTTLVSANSGVDKAKKRISSNDVLSKRGNLSNGASSAKPVLTFAGVVQGKKKLAAAVKLYVPEKKVTTVPAENVPPKIGG